MAPLKLLIWLFIIANLCGGALACKMDAVVIAVMHGLLTIALFRVLYKLKTPWKNAPGNETRRND